MLIFLALLLAGLIILVVAGDLLVRGAAEASLKMGVPPLVAAVVIVGFGTSAPEMLVALQSALTYAPGLAFGNIVGSNIANVLLVLSLPVLIYPIHTRVAGVRRVTIITALATAAWIGLTPVFGLSPLIGIIFFGAMIVHVASTLFLTKASDGPTSDLTDELPEPSSGWVKTSGFILLGIVGLPAGAHLAIEGAVGIARAFDMSDELIGLTLLAIGTSLPELAAGVAAAFRKNSDAIIGNVVGSNLFNILGAGGLVALVGPFDLPASFPGYDHWVLGLSFAVVLVYVLTRKSFGWATALLMLSAYIAYVYGLWRGWTMPWM